MRQRSAILFQYSKMNNFQYFESLYVLEYFLFLEKKNESQQIWTNVDIFLMKDPQRENFFVWIPF